LPLRPAQHPINGEFVEGMSIAPSVQVPNGFASGCEAYLITENAQLEELETEWGSLFDSAPTASPPLRWEWVREWWRIYGPVYGDRGRGLRVITVRRGSELIGVLPLYQRSESGRWAARQLRFISTGAAEFEETSTEYLDLLHAPQESSACIEAISRVIGNLQWDEVSLSNMSAESALLMLGGRLESWTRSARKISAGPCHLFDISGGFEAYLGRLSHENRRQARRLLRAVEQAGMTFELANDRPTVDQYFDQMVALHKSRWASDGKAGSFAPRHAEFHRSMAQKLVPSGAAILARLVHEGNPFAVLYAHRVREVVHCYQQGIVSESKELRSPGTAAWLLLMRLMAQEGVTLFDHQTGLTTFKERFATGERLLAELQIIKPTFRYLATTTADLVRRATKKAARLIKGTLPARRPALVTAPAPRLADLVH
jgi:CelD/BcsL family acetyltransferase involved in cellulose biosynthesis